MSAAPDQSPATAPWADDMGADVLVLNEAQQTALEFARTAQGGWPRAKANGHSWAIRSYRALERRGLVQEIKEDAHEVRGEMRLHFVAVSPPTNPYGQE
jgi:hypothetical protein